MTHSYDESLQRVLDTASLPRWTKQLVTNMHAEIVKLRRIAADRQPEGPVFQDDHLLPEPHYLIPGVPVSFQLGPDKHDRIDVRLENEKTVEVRGAWLGLRVMPKVANSIYVQLQDW